MDNDDIPLPYEICPYKGELLIESRYRSPSVLTEYDREEVFASVFKLIGLLREIESP